MDGSNHALTRVWKVASSATFALAVGIAIFSLRYPLGLPPTPESIAGNLYIAPWLPIHAGFAGIALLIGGLQFSGALRSRRPAVHRHVGRVYALSCLIAAVAGLVLAAGNSAGPIAGLGFSLLAWAWIVTNIMGWRDARLRLFASHRRWMVRSWALTLAAVTLRIQITLGEMMGFEEYEAYRVIAFISWMPNLIAAEIWLRVKALNPTVSATSPTG